MTDIDSAIKDARAAFARLRGDATVVAGSANAGVETSTRTGAVAHPAQPLRKSGDILDSANLRNLPAPARAAQPATAGALPRRRARAVAGPRRARRHDRARRRPRPMVGAGVAMARKIMRRFTLTEISAVDLPIGCLTSPSRQRLVGQPPSLIFPARNVLALDRYPDGQPVAGP
jgi:hypothetical protein